MGLLITHRGRRKATVWSSHFFPSEWVRNITRGGQVVYDALLNSHARHDTWLKPGVILFTLGPGKLSQPEPIYFEIGSGNASITMS